MEELEDSRIGRTRCALHDALISLVLERSFESLTVQEILDRAAVGRTTFYAHYPDKEALLTAALDEMRERLERGAATQSAPHRGRPAELIFEHVYRKRHVYRALNGRTGGRAVQRHLQRMVRDVLGDTMAAADPALPTELVAEFHTSATLGLLVWWIDQDFVHGPQWLAAAYRTLAAGAPHHAEPSPASR
jgi:AcrR family transcriptional regulator